MFFLGIAALLFGGGFLVRSVSNARSNSWAGPQTKGMRKRSQQGLQARGGQRPSIRSDMKRMTHEAHLSDWLDARKHDRAMTAKNGDGHTPTAPSAPPKVSRFGRRTSAAGIRQVIPGFAQRVPAAATAGTNGHGTPQSGGGSSPGAAPPGQNGNGQRNGWSPRNIRPGKPAPPPSPPRATSQTSQTSTSSGGNGTVASGNGHVEQLIEGYNGIYAEAVAGNIHDKHRGIKSAGEGSTRGSQMAAMLSRSMSEPGSNYGPEITEPLAKASQHEQAAAMAYAEADAALASLIQMSVGELATSQRQAPHHAELSENGSR